MPATGPADIADGTLMPARSSGAVGYNVHAAVVGMVSQSMARTRDLPKVLETARDASKATAEVACGRELCFDRLPRAVRSG